MLELPALSCSRTAQPLWSVGLRCACLLALRDVSQPGTAVLVVTHQVFPDLPLLQILGHQRVARLVLKHAWHKPAAKPIHCNLGAVHLQQGQHLPQLPVAQEAAARSASQLHAPDIMRSRAALLTGTRKACQQSLQDLTEQMC